MKLVGELKKKVNQAQTAEEAKQLIEDAGMQLTDEEMDNVAGGRRRREGDIGLLATMHEGGKVPMY